MQVLRRPFLLTAPLPFAGPGPNRFLHAAPAAVNRPGLKLLTESPDLPPTRPPCLILFSIKKNVINPINMTIVAYIRETIVPFIKPYVTEGGQRLADMGTRNDQLVWKR